MNNSYMTEHARRRREYEMDKAAEKALEEAERKATEQFETNRWRACKLADSLELQNLSAMIIDLIEEESDAVDKWLSLLRGYGRDKDMLSLPNAMRELAEMELCSLSPRVKEILARFKTPQQLDMLL